MPFAAGVIRLIYFKKGGRQDESKYALKSERNCLKETDQVLVFFNLFVSLLLFSLSFSYVVPDPQLDLEYRSVSLEGN